MAGLFVLFPLLLVSLLFIKPLNKPSVTRFRGLANLLGGILPLASLFLPYLFLGDYPWYPLNSYAVSQGVPQLIVVGCILTLFSRFGVLVTVAGLWDGSSVVIPCPAFGCHFTLGPGYWLGLTGATLSLLGRSWIVLPKSFEGRKVLGSIMFPAGVILAILAFFCGRVFCLGDFVAEDYVDRCIGTHYRYLGRWPGKVHVGPDVLASKHVVGSPIRLSYDNSKFGNRGFAVGIEEL